jgi:hypothetical protein
MKKISVLFVGLALIMMTLAACNAPVGVQTQPASETQTASSQGPVSTQSPATTVDNPLPNEQSTGGQQGQDTPTQTTNPKPKPSTTPPPPTNTAPGTGGNQYSLEQAMSDQAQLSTIAFSGLAFITGSAGADTFFPPGKVADFFGFQYMRDVDTAGYGHNTLFLSCQHANGCGRQRARPRRGLRFAAGIGGTTA